MTIIAKKQRFTKLVFMSLVAHFALNVGWAQAVNLEPATDKFSRLFRKEVGAASILAGAVALIYYKNWSAEQAKREGEIEALRQKSNNLVAEYEANHDNPHIINKFNQEKPILIGNAYDLGVDKEIIAILEKPRVPQEKLKLVDEKPKSSYLADFVKKMSEYWSTIFKF